VYHVDFGFGAVQIVNDAGFIAQFGSTSLPFNPLGQRAGARPNDPKLVGLGLPLTIWPGPGEDVTILLPLLNEAIAIMKRIKP
jgi:hypothetical protein